MVTRSPDTRIDRPRPPTSLYKYLSADRVDDVLRFGSAKFTPLANTNDIFEVRKTFERFAGPRFRDLLNREKEKVRKGETLERRFEEHLRDNQGHLSRHVRRRARKLILSSRLKTSIQKELDLNANLFAPILWSKRRLASSF